MSAPFVHLHNHSQYSLLDGACRLEDLVRRAAELGMRALALTDHGNMFGAIHFWELAASAGVKPIIGSEVYMTDGKHTERTRKSAYHLVLLARDFRGYKNLMKLTTKGYVNGFYYKPRIDLDLLQEHAEGLIGLSACLQGEINQALLRHEVSRAETLAGRFHEILGPDNFYVELQDHGIPAERSVHADLVGIARRLDLPLVCTNDCHYLVREHASAHDALLCIQTGKNLGDPNRMRSETDQLYIKTPDEMAALFPDLPEALANTLRIAERCEVNLELNKSHLPRFALPNGFGDPDAYLAHLCREGLKRRYPEASTELRERLDYELEIIRRMRYAGYFLIVQDFIRFAREKGIPVGPGRGSAAGSLVAYTTGITSIDPIRYGLLFERFLNPERVTMPDIDVDFSDRGRGEVIDYVVDRYGADSVAQIITFGTMAARAVVRDVGRVMGMSFAEVDKIAKMIPNDIGITLEKALGASAELQQASRADERVGRLLDHARTLEGLSRHASTHAAGVVIAPGPLTDFVPLYRTSRDEITTQYDMKAVEKIGLLKIDFLGLRTLSVIEDAARMIRENRGVAVDIEGVPLDDPAVYECFARGETVGIFQFESGGMREYLRKLRPDRFEDLIAMNALYRPGPLGSGMVDDYIERRHGQKAIAYPHPALEPILKSTYGVIVYQEQVMQIASALAGYTLGGADLLRRAMGKKIPEEMKKQRKTFIGGATKRGVDRDTAEKIFDLMEYFAGYGFNKSHSAGYALVAYQTAYLKTHYPVEFMAATLTSEMDDSDRVMALMSECRRMGVAVDPPDVNSSKAGFVAVGDRIRFGLAAVKGVGRAAVASIVSARERVGRFEDLFQFCREIDSGAVNRKALEGLICAGAMDALASHRAQCHAALAGAMARVQKEQRAANHGQASLFDAIEGHADARAPALPETTPWPEAERLRLEKDALGFYVSGHPLASVERELKSLASVTAEGLDHVGDDQSVTIGGIVVGVRRQLDKKGKTMARVVMEDFTGTFTSLVFSRLYEEAGALLADEARLLITGRASAREGERAAVIAESVQTLDDAFRGLDLHLRVGGSADLEIDRLKGLLETHPGDSRVVLHVAHDSGERKRPVIIRLRETRVDPDPTLVEALRGMLGADAVWLAGFPGAGRR
jgi:DNA polymerase-3 subunit alpha